MYILLLAFFQGIKTSFRPFFLVNILGPWTSITTINASLGIPFKDLRRFRKCLVSRTLEEHFLSAGFKKLSTYSESFTVADWYPATIGLKGGSYNLQKLQDVAKEISKVHREGLLHYKSKPSPVSKIPKDLFTQWHPQISKLSFSLKKHKDILTGSPELSLCFPEAPKVMYRRKRGIKDILCKSDIAPNPGSGKTKVQNHPCDHGNCILCPSFSKSNVITNRQNGHKFNILQGGTYRTKNIIYAAECVRHKKIHIGQSKNQLNKRFCCHRYDIKMALNNPNSTDIGGTELSDDFAKTPHSAGDLTLFRPGGSLGTPPKGFCP